MSSKHQMTSLRQRLRPMLEDLDSLAGRRFALFIQTLIFLSLVSVSLETLPELPGKWRKTLDIFDLVVILVFTVEYVLRIWVARRPLRFIFSLYGLIDLAVIAPFWLMGADIRALRAFRLLRLVRVLKLVRYSRSLNHFWHAWRLVRADIQMFAGFVAIFLYLSALGIWHFEHEAQPETFASVFDALWWAVVTLTTVGYGDLYPVTAGGRLFTMLVVLLGIGLVAVPSGLLASAFQEVRRNEREIRRLRRRQAHDGDSSGHQDHG